MTKKPPASVPHEQVVARLLKNRPTLATAYVEAAAEDANDAVGKVVLLRALRRVARAKGVSKVAAAAGLKVQSLSRALSDRGNPRLSTLVGITSSLGLKMTLVETTADTGSSNAPHGSTHCFVAHAKVVRKTAKKAASASAKAPAE